MELLLRPLRKWHLELGFKTISRQEAIKRYASPQEGSQFVSLLGSKLHFRDQGTGPIILALHGMSDSLHTWDGWVHHLQNEYRILRFDIPGFGLSTLPPEEWGPDFFVRLIDAFLQERGITSPIAIAGNSLGGYLASLFAAERPQKVSALIAIDSASFPLEKAPWPVEFSDLPLFSTLTKKLIPKLIVTHTTQSLFGDPKLITEALIQRFHDLTITEGNRESYVTLFRRMKSLKKENPLHLDKVVAPTFLMWGELDTWIPTSHIELWLSKLPQADLKVYPGCGHMPQLERPKETAADARDFLIEAGIT